MSEPIGSTRRNFQQIMIGSATSLISAALALPALAYVFSPLRRGASSGWAEAGDIRSLPVNEPAEMVFRKKRTDGWKTIIEKSSAWVVKSSDGEVVAFAPHCTHLGCGYHWDEKNNNFLCPCHASTFAANGDVLTGPAPRPLDRFETRIEGTRLWLGRVSPSPASSEKTST